MIPRAGLVLLQRRKAVPISRKLMIARVTEPHAARQTNLGVDARLVPHLRAQFPSLQIREVVAERVGQERARRTNTMRRSRNSHRVVVPRPAERIQTTQYAHDVDEVYYVDVVRVFGHIFLKELIVRPAVRPDDVHLTCHLPQTVVQRIGAHLHEGRAAQGPVAAAHRVRYRLLHITQTDLEQNTRGVLVFIRDVNKSLFVGKKLIHAVRSLAVVARDFLPRLSGFQEGDRALVRSVIPALRRKPCQPCLEHLDGHLLGAPLQKTSRGLSRILLLL
mmetsp:Transcript_7165/g.20021  ORF Transcript_7165/g.20021 Transcript_7165/m.20021 type:complete len:276 (-) Transcript_7165:1412-2239(-)